MTSSQEDIAQLDMTNMPLEVVQLIKEMEPHMHRVLESHIHSLDITVKYPDDIAQLDEIYHSIFWSFDQLFEDKYIDEQVVKMFELKVLTQFGKKLGICPSGECRFRADDICKTYKILKSAIIYVIGQRLIEYFSDRSVGQNLSNNHYLSITKHYNKILGTDS